MKKNSFLVRPIAKIKRSNTFDKPGEIPHKCCGNLTMSGCSN